MNLSQTYRRPALCAAIALLFFAIVPAPPAGAQPPTSAMSNAEESLVKQLYQDVLASQRLAVIAVNGCKVPEVRTLAGTVRDALNNATEGLKNLATKKSIQLSDDLAERNQSSIEKLNNAGGDDYDKTYIGIVLDHIPKLIQACQSTVDRTSDVDLKALLSRFIPALQNRLEAVQAVKSQKSW